MTKFAFVSAERANHAVATLCRVIGASVGEALLVAERKIGEKYAALNAHRSPLGLPLSPNTDFDVFTNTFSKQYRGGVIRVTDPLSGSSADAFQTRYMEVYWKGLIGYTLQESTDEVYGVCAAVTNSTGETRTIGFPPDARYWEFRNDLDFIDRGDLIYSGPPTDLTLICQLCENDSGNTNAFVEAVSQRLSEVAATLLVSQGVPAEEVAKSDFFLDEIFRAISTSIRDVLGTNDDPYNPKTELIRAEDVLAGVYGWAHEPILHNRNLVATGTDDGGDTGEYGFLFEVVSRPFGPLLL